MQETMLLWLVRQPQQGDDSFFVALRSAVLPLSVLH
jgi:hypothetical protein